MHNALLTENWGYMFCNIIQQFYLAYRERISLAFLQAAGSHWFYTESVHDWLYLIRELNFFEGNRCNIWLIKGSTHDVIIDTGVTSREIKFLM